MTADEQFEGENPENVTEEKDNSYRVIMCTTHQGESADPGDSVRLSDEDEVAFCMDGDADNTGVIVN